MAATPAGGRGAAPPMYPLAATAAGASRVPPPPPSRPAPIPAAYTRPPDGVATSRQRAAVRPPPPFLPRDATPVSPRPSLPTRSAADTGRGGRHKTAAGDAHAGRPPNPPDHRLVAHHHDAVANPSVPDLSRAASVGKPSRHRPHTSTPLPRRPARGRVTHGRPRRRRGGDGRAGWGGGAGGGWRAKGRPPRRRRQPACPASRGGQPLAAAGRAPVVGREGHSRRRAPGHRRGEWRVPKKRLAVRRVPDAAAAAA